MKQVLAFVGGLALGVGGCYAYQKVKSITGFGAADAIKNAVDVHARQIQRYAFAASQDMSPTVGITHASYALILLDTLEEIIGRDAVRDAGLSPQKIRKFITDQQDRHAKKLQGCDAHLQTILTLAKREGINIAGGVGGAPRGA